MLIDHFLPEYDIAERHRVIVRAPSGAAWEAIHRVDLAGSPFIRLLFVLRGLPALIWRRRRPASRSTMTLDDLLRSGFVRLGEDPGGEIVLGVVGKFWRPTGGLRPVDPNAFADLAEPGWAKAAWNYFVRPLEDGRSVVYTETRVSCTDERSRRRFILYWAVIGPFSGLVRKQTLRLIKADAEHPGSSAEYG